MAAKAPTREQRNPCLFLSALSSAFFEWILIILLLTDALLSYMVTKFACYCQLPTPCVLCSRLDWIRGRNKMGIYNNLICNVHKLEISSLAYCSTHQRLSDACEMCQGCLLSSVDRKRVDFDDTLNADFLPRKPYGEDVTKVPLLKKSLGLDPLSIRHCSCCLEPFRSKLSARMVSQSKPPTRANSAEPDASVSGSNYGDGLSNAMENPSRALTIYQASERSFDRLPHIGYSELKITSDSESEVPSEDEPNALARETDSLKEELMSHCLQAAPETIIPIDSTQVLPEGLALEKPTHSLSMPKASLSLTERKHQAGIGHGSEETSWSQVEVRPDTLVFAGITQEHVPTEDSKQKPDVAAIGDGSANGEVIKAFTSTDKSLKMSNIMNEKLASGIKGPLPSPSANEFVIGRETSRASEDLRLRLSQICGARWPEFSWNEMNYSPRVNGQVDESKLSDASSSSGKRFSMQGLESLDESLVSELDGESAVERLKRQIEMDRKSMRILYKELEEERSAAAVAANEAMAMINRLQEEKAAMQMEALQYLRMMEEQTEYDQEALQKLNDLLSDRDKEIQDLEAEVESYREQFGIEPLTRKSLEPSMDSEERDYSPVSTPRFVRSRGRDTGSDLVKNTVLDFEEEKAYISESLRRLEKKLQLFSNNKVSAVGSEVDTIEEGPPDKCSVLEDCTSVEDPKETVGDSNQELRQRDSVTEENNQRKGVTVSENSSLAREDLNIEAISTPTSSRSVRFSFKDALSQSRSRSVSFNESQLQVVKRRSDVIALGNEVSRLSARLETLEADRSFLEHTIKSLRNGSHGLQFVQEIACHLRELRRFGNAYQDRTVA